MEKFKSEVIHKLKVAENSTDESIRVIDEIRHVESKESYLHCFQSPEEFAQSAMDMATALIQDCYNGNVADIEVKVIITAKEIK